MSDTLHSTSDLFLAPVATHLDDELQRLGALSEADLLMRVTLRTDREPRDVADRRLLLAETLRRSVATHGWDLDWDARGLAVRHGDRHLVLGLPESVRRFIAA